MERGGILLHAQVNQAQVVEDLPVKRGEVGGPLQATDGRHKLGLTEKAHPDVVPEGRRLGNGLGRHLVLGEGHVVILVGLHHGAGRQDRPGVLRLKCQGRAEILKRGLVTSWSQGQLFLFSTVSVAVLPT